MIILEPVDKHYRGLRVLDKYDITLTCDACNSDMEMGYTIDGQQYCNDCTVDYMKKYVCDRLWVDENGDECPEDYPGAEEAYDFEGSIYKDDADGVFDDILLSSCDEGINADPICLEGLKDDFEDGVLDIDDYLEEDADDEDVEDYDEDEDIED